NFLPGLYSVEFPHCTSLRHWAENSYVENGNLYIMAKRETFTDQGQTKPFTSARLNSKFAFTYGRVEVRAQMPFGVGTWPAIWMLGKNINEPGAYWQPTFGTVGWPACGEIDIMEHWGNNQGFVQSATHTPSSSGATINKSGLTVSDVSTAFHVYALDWYPDRLEFSLDGNVYYTYQPDVRDADTWPFDADQYILLNVAIQNIIEPSFTQSPMIVDYVRVYQEPVASDIVEVGIRGVKMYPNPVKDQLNIELPELSEKISVTVQTPEGKVLEEFVTQDIRLRLDWSRFARGIYLVKLTTPSGLKGTYKVLKE
ncbi:MAG: family 16 glycosylhydrolase, partial [Bacteroidota bacterium]